MANDVVVVEVFGYNDDENDDDGDDDVVIDG